MDGSKRAAGSGSLSTRTIRGLGWVYVSTGVTAVGQLVYTIVMSRLLSPAAFGVFAVAWLARGFALQVSQLGIASALIQKPKLSVHDIRAGFTLSALLGLASFGLFWVMAPTIADLFRNPEIAPILRAMGGTVVVSALHVTPDALLRRDLRFRETALAGMTAFIVGYLAVGLGSALAGAGVWSLVVAQFGTFFTYWLITYSMTRHSLRPTARLDSMRAIGGYGSRLTIINLLEFVGVNVDTYAVGKYSGTSLLGQYNRIFNLVLVPLYLLSVGLVQVLLSGFSAVQEDLTRLRRAFGVSVSASAAILFPICAGIAIASREVVIVTIGSEYRDAIPAVPYLTIVGAVAMMSRLYGSLCESLARHGARMLLQVLYLFILVPAMLAVSGGQLWPYAAVLAGCEIARHIGYQLIARRLIHLGLGDIMRMYWRPALAAAVVALTSVAVRSALGGATPPLVLLLAQVAADAIAMIVMIRLGPLTFVLTELKRGLGETGSRINSVMSSRLFRIVFGAIG